MFSKSNLDYTIFSSIIGGLKKYDAYRFILRKELAIPPSQEGGRERERQRKNVFSIWPVTRNVSFAWLANARVDKLTILIGFKKTDQETKVMTVFLLNLCLLSTCSIRFNVTERLDSRTMFRYFSRYGERKNPRYEKRIKQPSHIKKIWKRKKNKKNFRLFGAPVPKADDDCVKSAHTLWMLIRQTSGLLLPHMVSTI